MVPSWSVSICASADSRRDGTSKCCRFLLPQSVRNLITSLFARTAVTISAFSSVPESSSSIIWKTLRAAVRNSALNSSSAAAAARSRRSRSFAICSRRFARPRLIAVSLRASGVMPLRGGGDASMASRRRQTNDMKPWRTPRDAPLVDVHFSGTVRVQDLERLLEARRVQ